MPRPRLLVLTLLLAVRAGAPVTHVADAAQLARQTVYDAIARVSERSP